MKIMLSPSKTANYQNIPYIKETALLFPAKTKKVVATIRKLHQTELGKALHIQGDLLKQTFYQYKQFYQNPSFQAFSSYDGLVYKQLHKEQYGLAEYDYINNHVRIVDALYGLLYPGTMIKPYRLDMKAQVGIHLYQYWDIDSAIDDDLIINLASTEFSMMIHRPMVTIMFLQKKGNGYRNQATFTKMARGSLLQYMIVHKVSTVEEIKEFKEDGYHYDQTQSNDSLIVFIR